jgi:hypothetical protein
LFDFTEISYVGRLWCPELFPRHRQISTGLHFQNGHQSYLWNWTMLNFCGIVVPFWKWRPVEICRCRESIQDMIIYLHMKFRW